MRPRTRRCFGRILVCAGLLFVASAIVYAKERPADERDVRLPDSDFQAQRTKGYVENVPDADYHHASEAAYEAFRDIKYGVRIHWGLYSIKGLAHESWPFLGMTPVEKQAYQEQYKTWNPAGFDAEEWMKLFEEGGLRMFAFTSKHHEGFSMFDTKTRVHRRVNWIAPGGPAIEDCDLAYSIMETPFHRDVVKELCDAGHKHGIKIDLYFSNPDWYDADFRPYGWHPLQTPGSRDDAVEFGGTFDPKRIKPQVFVPDPAPEESARMIARYRAQLTELLTNYGAIDMLCLDNWLGKHNWPEVRDTIKAIRKIQPDVMLRARGIGNYGDYYTPEGFVPGSKANTGMPWFVIYPLAQSFSYDPDAKHYKGAKWIVKNVVDVVAKGGNFMVSVGPDADGKFHPAAVAQLRDAGAWLKVNGQAIYDTRPRPGDAWHEGDAIRYTRTKDGRTTYVISLDWPGAKLTLKTIKPDPGSQVVLLGDDRLLPWRNSPEGGAVIDLPAESPFDQGKPAGYAYVFKFATGATRPE